MLSNAINSFLRDNTAMVEQEFKRKILEPMKLQAEALVHTLPLELGLINSLDTLNTYSATVRIEGNRIKITPDPGIAMWVEEGKPAWDVASLMLNSPAAKRAADGNVYVDVPINSAEGKKPSPGTVQRSPIWFQGERDQIIKKTRDAFVPGDERRKALQGMAQSVMDDVRRVAMMKHGKRNVANTRYTDRTVKMRRIVKGARWMHPGFAPTHILRTIETEVNSHLAQMIGEWLDNT